MCVYIRVGRFMLMHLIKNYSIFIFKYNKTTKNFSCEMLKPKICSIMDTLRL